MLHFKRGAFEGLRTVQPFVTTVIGRPDWMRPSWECLGFLEQVILVGTAGTYSIKLEVLPPLKPTDYMWEKFADKGKTKPEIFAWVARDVMAKVAKVEKLDCYARDKARYKDFMTGKVDEIEANGKKFTAPPLPSCIPFIGLCKRKRKPRPDKPKEE